jgi:hypothetical protein
MATGDINAVVNVLQTQNTLISQVVKALTATTTLLTSGITVTPALSSATQSDVAAPIAPASTTAFTMQGLGGSITPIRTGIVLIIISGVINSAAGTAGNGITYEISIGAGSAPVNGAALTGVVLGVAQIYTNQASVTAANVNAPFSIQATVTGLTAGTTLWVDLAAKSIATVSDVGLTNVSVTAFEQ